MKISICPRWLAIFLVVLSTLAVSGCDLDRFKTTAAEEPQLVDSVLSEPKTFNAALSNESPNIFGLTYEGLVTLNYNTQEIEPALAESWRISENKKEIIFTLREGLQWSDGEPLTAADVDFTFNRIYFNEEIPTSTRDVLRIGKEGKLPEVTQISDREVKFTVPQPFAPFLRTIGSATILPKHALEDTLEPKTEGDDLPFLSTWGIDTDPQKIVFSGPYVLEGYNTSQRLQFRRNPYYWREDQQGNAQPYIERINWEIVENQDTALLQFRSGGLDTVSVSPQNFSLLKQEEERNNFTIYNGGPTASKSFIFFNLNRASRGGEPLVTPYKSRWFTDVKFRRAIAYGINRSKMLNNIFRGLGQKQHSPISVQSPYYYSPEEGLKTYDYDPEKAKELLFSIGFRTNENGEMYDGEGHRVEFTLLTNAGNQTRESMGAQIKQDLAQIGIKVNFQPIAFNTLVSKLSSTRDWECVILGLTGGVEPNNGANVWLPEGRLHMFNQGPQPGDDSPLKGWKVADWERKIGDLYIQGAQELNEEKRKEIYAETQQLTQEYLPFIYLVNPLAMSAIRDRVRGVDYSALGGALWNIHELEIVE